MVLALLDVCRISGLATIRVALLISLISTVAVPGPRVRPVVIELALHDGLEEESVRRRRPVRHGTSIAAVTLIESDKQFMKSASGIEPIELTRDQAFCDITIRRAAHFVIEDAKLDSRYADYSVATSDSGVRFYAGYPIEAPNGQRVGALCVMDREPRHFSDEDAGLPQMQNGRSLVIGVSPTVQMTVTASRRSLSRDDASEFEECRCRLPIRIHLIALCYY